MPEYKKTQPGKRTQSWLGALIGLTAERGGGRPPSAVPCLGVCELALEERNEEEATRR